MENLTPTIANRIGSLDFLRGIAVLGILLLNIEGYSFPSFHYNQFTSFTGINYWIIWIIEVFFDGTMRGIFSMLFGVSCLLLLNKTNDINSIDIYFRRLLWLFILGLFNAYILLWDGDILYNYAICGMFLFAFRNLNVKFLIVISLALMIGSFLRPTYKFLTERKPTYMAYKSAMVDSLKHHKKLSLMQKEKIETFKEMSGRFKKDTSAINSEIRTMRGSFTSVFNKRWKDGEWAQKWTIYDLGFWDYILMMFLGMAFYKFGFFTGQFSTKNIIYLLIFSYFLGLIMRIRFANSIYYTQKEFEAFFETYTIPTGAYFNIQRALMTVGHLCLLMLIYLSGKFKLFIKIISKVGQMALTNYFLESIICGLFFYGFGFGMFAKLQIYQNYLFCIIVWIICISFSNIWLHYFKMGPFEWIWRSLTYWNKQGMLKK